MSNETTVPAVAKNTGLEAIEETALVVAGDHGGFTEEESLSGMSPVMQGYVKSYNFFMFSDNGIFKLINNRKPEKDQIVWEGETIDTAVVYYSHHVKTLKRGSMNGRTDKESTWTDDEKELVALSYDEKSKGNFERNNLGDYLRKPLWSAVQTKVYMFAVFPELPSGKNPVACSFGITTDMVKKSNSLANYRLEIERIKLPNGTPANFPIGYLTTVMYHQPDKNDAGDSYRRVSFRFKKGTDGRIITSHDGKEAYVKSPVGLEMWRKIKKTHEAAVEHAESGELAMGGGSSERTVPAIAANDGHSPEPFQDEIPY